jgi:hypothetical protein
MEKGLIRPGTLAFTAAGWPESFYPENMKPAMQVKIASQCRRHAKWIYSKCRF